MFDRIQKIKGFQTEKISAFQVGRQKEEEWEIKMKKGKKKCM